VAPELENNSLKENKFSQKARPESLDSISEGGKTERPKEGPDVTEIPKDVLGVDVETILPETTKAGELSPDQKQILAQRRTGVDEFVQQKRQGYSTGSLVEFIDIASRNEATGSSGRYAKLSERFSEIKNSLN